MVLVVLMVTRAASALGGWPNSELVELFFNIVGFLISDHMIKY